MEPRCCSHRGRCNGRKALCNKLSAGWRPWHAVPSGFWSKNAGSATGSMFGFRHWRQCSCRRRGCRWICCGSRPPCRPEWKGQHPVGQHLSEPRPRKWTCHRPSQWRVGPPPPFSPLFPPSPSLWVEWSLPARGGPEIRVPGA